MFHNVIRFLILAVVLVMAGAHAQDVVPAEIGPRGVCASADLNDPVLIRQAYLNTELQHPGIFEAARVQRLQKGTLDLRIGDQNLFWVYNINTKTFDTLRAELKAIGTISYVWVALGEWANGHVTQVEVDAVEQALERTTSSTSLDSSKGILQIDRQVYGDPPNINASFQKGLGDGKTHFLLCDIQDGWNGSGSFVAGFFFSVDVDPISGAVNTSNRRDMLYIDTYPGIYYGGSRRTSTALSTLAHEFQHLIHWNYDPREVTFFNEGWSEYAEFLCGFPLRSAAGYLGNTNVTLTGWNNTVEDYSRAALWTRFTADQYGLGFLKIFVQNTSTGTTAYDQTLAQSGFSTTFAATMTGFFTANWLGSNSPDPAYRYSAPLNIRPSLRGDYTDPTVQRSDTLIQQGVQYISFASARNFRVTFNVPSGVIVRAIESGPTSTNIRDVTGGVEFTSPGLGTQFASVVFVVMNSQGALSPTYRYAASGDLLHFLVEEGHDSGTPHVYSQGYAPYLGFGNNATTLGMAVRFMPESRWNVLHTARFMVAFNQEFSNGTALPSDNQNFVLHVWGDQNGRPGADLITPFLVSVDRNRYPFGSFVDVDLSAWQNSLTNLTGPVYVGFMEAANDSVGTYLGVDNFVQGDYSYVFRGPNYTRIPNTWETMTEVSAVNSHKLDGFNLMIRAVFEYSDSSAAPTLAIGYLQNPLLSEFIDVVTASPDDLRAASLSGSITQTAGSSALRFSPIPGTLKAFIDTTQQLKGAGAVTLRVRGAKKFGFTYADTSVSLNARLLKGAEGLTISTPDGNVSVDFSPGSVSAPVYLTASNGLNNPNLLAAEGIIPLRTFSVGPAGMALANPAALTVTGIEPSDSLTIAFLENGQWIPLPTTMDRSDGGLHATVSRLGSFGVVRNPNGGGETEIVPKEFSLSQNYPNPFNPSTTIEFRMPGTAFVTLKVFDLLGREVATLVDGLRSPGQYTVHWDASGFSSGVYLMRIHAGNFIVTRKMVLTK